MGQNCATLVGIGIKPVHEVQLLSSSRYTLIHFSEQYWRTPSTLLITIAYSENRQHGGFLTCKNDAIKSDAITLLCGPPPQEGAAYCVALCPSVCPSVPLADVLCLQLHRLTREHPKQKNFGFRLWASVTYVLFGTRRAAYRTAISAAQILVTRQ